MADRLTFGEKVDNYNPTSKGKDEGADGRRRDPAVCSHHQTKMALLFEAVTNLDANLTAPQATFSLLRTALPIFSGCSDPRSTSALAAQLAQ